MRETPHFENLGLCFWFREDLQPDQVANQQRLEAHRTTVGSETIRDVSVGTCSSHEAYKDQVPLTCDLFRHQGEAEIFDVEVLFPEDGDVTGSVLCRVQAENLTKPVELRISVSRTVETFDVMDLAEEMVEALSK